MNIFILILCIVSSVAHADEAGRDPFAPAMKTAAELIQCVNGHKTLRDVPVVYGHVGGLRSDPETAAKAERGEIVFGGCILGGRDHLVVCATCGLSYDDTYEAWQESFPADPFAPDSKRNPPCTVATIRQELSKELKGITLDVAGSNSSYPSYCRWIDSSGIVGEQVLVLTETKNAEVQTKLEGWIRRMSAPKNPVLSVLDTTDRRWEWMKGDKSFDIDLNASGKGGSSIRLEWHTVEKEAEQAVDGNPH